MLQFPNTYFDNASTSWPKPPEVGEAMNHFLREEGGTYGRAAYDRVYRTSMTVEACRGQLAELLGVAESGNIAFTGNATQALNTILLGLGLENREVLVSPLEHNAVMRPLEHLKNTCNARWRVLPAFKDGLLDVEKIPRFLGKDTRLLIVNHQSNVNGLVQPIEKIREYVGELPILVDAAQSLGSIPVKADEWGIDFIAFTGHKGLSGPTGTGGFFTRDTGLVSPLWYGGTGSQSASLEMPGFSPDKYEAGTHNTVGLSGLLAALKHEPRAESSPDIINGLIDRLNRTEGVKVLTPENPRHRGNLFSLVHERLTPSDIARYLYDRHGIEIRSGLHCAPNAHEFLGTFPAGSARFAFSPYHTPGDLAYLEKGLIDLFANS